MKYGLIGEKLGHSFSKIIHEKIADYTYELREIPKSEIDEFMKKREFTAINVTIPYKQTVIPYLDYIDPVADEIGAVNTVVNREGKLYGYNTDFGGLKMLIEKQGFSYEGKKVLVTGTGGTSKTACAVAGALGAAKIITVSRGRGDTDYQRVYCEHGDADFIINTTPLGMYPDLEGCCLDLGGFPRLMGVTDVVYNPLRTSLCLSARERGISADCGLYMLICQAVLASEIFTGKKKDVKAVSDSFYASMLSEKESIVLVGMPGCGKTTVARAISALTGRSLYDTDEIIREKHGEISDIFAEKGEAYFRDLEAQAVREVSAYSSCVIATGGGAVLGEENRRNLRHNGKIFFLDRPLEDIVPTDDRPLSSSREALEKRYKERYPIYLSCCDEVISVDGVVENTVRKIMECMK